jgi:hypothetical protein
MPRAAFLLLLLAVPLPLLHAQTFSPQGGINKYLAAWSVCTSSDVTAVHVYTTFVDRGLVPLTYDTAVTVLTNKQARSTPVKIVAWAGYAAAAATFALTTHTVAANPKWQEGFEYAAGFINVIIPFAQHAEPALPAWFKGLVKDTDTIKAGTCGYIVAQKGKAFVVAVSESAPPLTVVPTTAPDARVLTWTRSLLVD